MTRTLVAAALLALACGAEPPPAADARGPNVLLITADDLGWRDPSSYGNPDVETPSIDRLAAEGMRFTRAFVAASSCSSSRASLTTGQYPHTHGVTGLSHRHPSRMLSPATHAQLADVLADAGYRTGLAGKWHVAPYLPTGWYGYDERMGGLMDMWIRDIAPVLEFVGVRPAIVNAVPGRCDLTLDQRHLDPEALERMLQGALDAARDIAAEERCEVSIERLWRIDPIPFDGGLLELANRAVEEVAGTSLRLASGPLHDAAEVARAGVPTVMLFVQSLRGLSHTREEDTLEAHIEMSVEALDRLATGTLERLAS